MLSSPVPRIAWRFLFSRRSEGLLSLISVVSVVGVALGVTALVVVTSVMNGFEGELKRVISGLNGDIILYSRGEPVSQPEEAIARIRKVAPESTAVTPSFVAEIMVSGPAGVAGAILEGIDPATVGSVTDIAAKLVSGRLPTDSGEVSIPEALASRIGARIGSEIRLILPFAGAAPGDKDDASVSPKVARARVAGILKIGMYEYDSKYLYSTLTAAQEFAQHPGKATSFRIRVRDGADPREIAARLGEHFGYPFRAKDWGQLNKNLLYAIELEKVVIAIILGAITLVAAFNVVSTLMMMIHDKAKEIAILKAMGFRRAQSFALFSATGLGIGAVGALAGLGVGLALALAVERQTFFRLPVEIYFLDRLPVRIEAREIGMIAGFAVLASFLATIYPALRVAGSAPSKGLRYE